MTLNIAAIDAVLDVHEQQGAPKVVVDFVRRLINDEDRIESTGYVPQKIAELKQERRAETVAAIADALAALEADEAKAAETRRQTSDREAQERATRTNGHAVDSQRITTSTTAGEIALLLREADESGD